MAQPSPNTDISEQPRTQAERTALAESSMVRAAIELLNTVGLQGTTLVAIGERSGYSRGLVSHHFGSKAALFRVVLRQMTAVWTEELIKNIYGKTGLAAFNAAIETHLVHIQHHPDYIRATNILWGAALDPSSEFKPNVGEFMSIQRDSVAAWVRGGQALGEIRADLNPDRIGEQYYAALIGINHQWLVSPDFDLEAAYQDFKLNMVRLLKAQ